MIIMHMHFFYTGLFLQVKDHIILNFSELKAGQNKHLIRLE